jgi:hypothetical protein
MTTTMRGPNYFKTYKRELIIGGSCLVLGYLMGVLKTASDYDNALVKQIFTQITEKQDHMREESRKFDEAFDRRQKEFDEELNGSETLPKKKNSRLETALKKVIQED